MNDQQYRIIFFINNISLSFGTIYIFCLYLCPLYLFISVILNWFPAQFYHYFYHIVAHILSYLFFIVAFFKYVLKRE